MKAKGITFYPNPNDDDGRRVLDYLHYSGTSHTKAITAAILFYLDARERGNEPDRLLQQVRDTIRESIQGLQIQSKGTDFAAVETDSSEEVSMLDFLDALESEVTFEEM